MAKAASKWIMDEVRNNLRVVVVAPYAATRAGLHALLSEADSFDLLDELASAEDFRSLLPTLCPDVLLADISGGEGDAEDNSLPCLISPLRETGIALVVLGDSPATDIPRLSTAALSGWAYLSRDSDGAQLAAAVRAAASNLIVLDPLFSAWATPASPVLVARPTDLLPGEALTAREIEVLQTMAQGLPNKIIATKLGISLHTVKFHVAQILGKLNASSRTEAVTIGARRGYVLL